MLLKTNQTNCKVLSHRSTWLTKDVYPNVLNLAMALWSPCLDKITARPFYSVLPDPAFSLLSGLSLFYSLSLNSPSPSSSPISLSSCTSLLGPPLASVTHLIELPSLLSRDMHMTPLWLDCELTEDKRYLSWLILGPAQLEASSLWLSVDLCSYQSLNPNSDIWSSHHTHHRGSLMCFPYSRTLLPKIHTHMSTYVHTCISMCVCICACIYTFSATCWLSKSRSCV